MSDRTCSVKGCDKPARSLNEGAWCERHYMRWYRHGDPLAGVDVNGFKAGPQRHYRRVRPPAGHPMRTKNGAAYEHRVVLFDTIGYGPHRCHWCDAALTWGNNLHVDHLDRVKDNNDPTNLVPTCQPCNSRRAAADKAILARRAGYWHGKDARRPKAERTALRLRETDALSA